MHSRKLRGVICKSVYSMFLLRYFHNLKTILGISIFHGVTVYLIIVILLTINTS